MTDREKLTRDLERIRQHGGKMLGYSIRVIDVSLIDRILDALRKKEDCEPRCVGCNLTFSEDQPYVMDDNGEVGCPACFSENGEGDCFNELSRLTTLTPTGADYERMREAAARLCDRAALAERAGFPPHSGIDRDLIADLRAATPRSNHDD